MAILNETKKSTKFKQTLFGGRKNIFTLCIASAENPGNVTLSAEENKARNDKLISELKRFKLAYYPVNGRYGGPDEHSFLIPNISLDLCKYLFGKEKFDQETFIFGIVDDSENPSKELEDKKVQQNTRINFYVYKQDDKGNFYVNDEETKIIDDDNAEYFTIFKKFKFSIPFKTFLEGVEEISSLLEEKYGWKENYRDVLRERALSEGKTIKHFWILGGELLTEEQELERLKRLGFVSQDAKTLSETKGSLRDEIISLSKN